MCTAFKFKSYFGRNFDYEESYDEELILIPPHYKKTNNKYGIIGIGSGMVQDYPLLYDGINSEGLCCAGLAFSGNAHYFKEDPTKDNIPPYDFIVQILGNFDTVKSVKEYLKNVNIVDIPYSRLMPNTDLHWIIADKEECITVESTKYGLGVYDNFIGVLTNNPPFKEQELYMLYHTRLDQDYPSRSIYNSRGTNTFGLKGDYTSIGRFERCAYLKERLERNDIFTGNEINSTFHLLSGVEQIYGVTPINDKYEYTIYSVVYDMENYAAYAKLYTGEYASARPMKDRKELHRIRLRSD